MTTPDQETLVEIYSSADAVPVVLLRERLDEAGIEHRIAGDPLHKAVPRPATDAQVWVRAYDRKAAEAICRKFDQRLAQLDRTISVEAGTVFCCDCGESVGEETDVCPACSCPLT